MRNRMLHGLLAAFAEDAGLQLAHDTANGAEVPFEVVEEPGARSPLYCYRPLTSGFIRSRMGVLDRLPSYLPAARGLAAIDGVDAYLRRRGEPRIPPAGRERADAVLRSFLSAVFAETSAFGYQPEAFSAAYAELEATLYEGRQVATVVAPLLGSRSSPTSSRSARACRSRAASRCPTCRRRRSGRRPARSITGRCSRSSRSRASGSPARR